MSFGILNARRWARAWKKRAKKLKAYFDAERDIANELDGGMKYWWEQNKKHCQRIQVLEKALRGITYLRHSPIHCQCELCCRARKLLHDD